MTYDVENPDHVDAQLYNFRIILKVKKSLKIPKG